MLWMWDKAMIQKGIIYQHIYTEKETWKRKRKSEQMS